MSNSKYGCEDGVVVLYQPKQPPKRDTSIFSKVKDLILGPDQRRSKTPQPQMFSNASNYETRMPNYKSSGGARVRMPPVSKSQELRNQSASSSQGGRNGTREDERYQIRAPSPGSYEEAVNGGVMEKLESYLKLAEDSTEAVHKMYNSLKFNNEQCEYLAEKLKVVAQRARGELGGISSSEDSTRLTKVVKLLAALGKQIESFFKGCCSDDWVQAAMTLTMVSGYVALLGFNLELCRLAFGKDGAATGWLTLDEVLDLSKAEAEIVEKKAEVDLKSLVRKVTLELNFLEGEDRYLAGYLLQRLLRVEPSSTCEDGTFLEESFNSVKSGMKLGSGTSASVYQGTWLGLPVAKKTFVGLGSVDFSKEVEILSRLCHANITSMFGCTESEKRKRCSIIMELMDGNLQELMDRRFENCGTSRPFSILEAVDIMLQIGEGVNYLHDQKIVHRDLKSTNILVKTVKTGDIEYVHAKVADFGISKAKANSTTHSELTPNQGTNRWMPPEVIQLSTGSEGSFLLKSSEEPKHPFKCDTYSFGMVCFEILTGHVPFSDFRSALQIKQMILNKERPILPNESSECPLKLKSVIEKCWSHDPKERPTLRDVCGELKYLKYLLLTTKSIEELEAKCKLDTSRPKEGRTKQISVMSGQPGETKMILHNQAFERVEDYEVQKIPGIKAPAENWLVGNTSAHYAGPISPRKASNEPDSRTNPLWPFNGSDSGSHVPSHQSGGGARLRLPPISKSQELRNQVASSSHGQRHGSPEDDRYQITALPPGSYQDTGSLMKNLVMAVFDLKSAVDHFATALISDMNRYPEELKHLNQTIRREFYSEVDTANHWKFLVQAFVCKRLFEDFEAENGFFGIHHLAKWNMSTAVSFADFTSFKENAATISGLLAKDSRDVSFLGQFCFKKFKSISGDLASDQPWPLYAEDWRIVDQERHPQSEFYQSFLKIGVSVWILHRLVWSFEQGWRMLGWDTFPHFSKFERKSMESVVPGGFEEDVDEMGTDVNTVVGFVVIPGFQVSKSVVKCEVYLRNLNNINSGRIMEASEVPAREKSLEKSFSRKTSASSQPGGSFRTSESYGAMGSFLSSDEIYIPRSSASFPTPDSAKSSSNPSSPSSRAIAESKFWTSGQTRKSPSGYIGGSNSDEGESSRSKSGQLDNKS